MARKGLAWREYWHLHGRDDATVVPRPVLVKVSQFEVHQYLFKQHGVRLTREAWDRVNTDRPCYRAADGLTYYLFTTLEGL